MRKVPLSYVDILCYYIIYLLWCPVNSAAPSIVPFPVSYVGLSHYFFRKKIELELTYMSHYSTEDSA